MRPISLSDILELSVSERIQLAQDIWDSIATEPEALTLTEQQRQELDRRLAGMEASTDAGTPWSAVRDRLLGLS